MFYGIRCRTGLLLLENFVLDKIRVGYHLRANIFDHGIELVFSNIQHQANIQTSLNHFLSTLFSVQGWLSLHVQTPAAPKSQKRSMRLSPQSSQRLEYTDLSRYQFKQFALTFSMGTIMYTILLVVGVGSRQLHSW